METVTVSIFYYDEMIIFFLLYQLPRGGKRQ